MCSDDASLLFFFFFFNNAETSNDFRPSYHTPKPREVCLALICNKCVPWPPACIIIFKVSSQHAKLLWI